MARLLIYPKQQRYNVRYEKNWIFIEANQFFYYFYLSFHNNVVRRCALQLLMSKQKTLDKQTLKEALQKETQKM